MYVVYVCFVLKGLTSFSGSAWATAAAIFLTGNVKGLVWSRIEGIFALFLFIQPIQINITIPSYLS